MHNWRVRERGGYQWWYGCCRWLKLHSVCSFHTCTYFRQSVPTGVIFLPWVVRDWRELPNLVEESKKKKKSSQEPTCQKTHLDTKDEEEQQRSGARWWIVCPGQVGSGARAFLFVWGCTGHLVVRGYQKVDPSLSSSYTGNSCPTKVPLTSP